MKILNIDYLKLIVILDNQGTCMGFVINKSFNRKFYSVNKRFSLSCSLYEEIISSIYIRFWIGFLILEKRLKNSKINIVFVPLSFFSLFHFCQLRV